MENVRVFVVSVVVYVNVDGELKAAIGVLNAGYNGWIALPTRDSGIPGSEGVGCITNATIKAHTRIIIHDLSFTGKRLTPQ